MLKWEKIFYNSVGDHTYTLYSFSATAPKEAEDVAVKAFACHAQLKKWQLEAAENLRASMYTLHHSTVFLNFLCQQLWEITFRVHSD